MGARGWRPHAITIAIALAELTLASGCARTLSASTRAPNPLTLGEWGGKADVTYDVAILIKDLKQPEGIAHPSQNQAGINYTGARAGILPGYVQPRYFPQVAV